MMRGQEELIALRMRRQVPAVVFADTAEWGGRLRREADLWIEPNDRIPRLDLRCVIGLHVVVIGEDRSRVSATVAAMRRANAKRVQSVVMQRCGEGEFTTFNVVEHTDTWGQEWQSF